jgi:nicotinamidase-related amidase
LAARRLRELESSDAIPARLSQEAGVHAGSWGDDWHPDFAPQPDDVVVKEHWGSSSFANTDLDVLL